MFNLNASISIVLPVYNEENNLQNLLYEWNVALEDTKIIYEFIIVEDGSTDNTKEIISSLEKNYPLVNLSQNKRRGYTQAVLDGITSAKSDYILCTDSDNQIKIDSLISCLDKLPNENEFLIG